MTTTTMQQRPLNITEANSALNHALTLLAENHPAQKTLISNVKKSLVEQTTTAGSLLKDLKVINAGIGQTKNQEALELRIVTSDIKQELNRLSKQQTLSAHQVKEISSIEIGGNLTVAEMLNSFVSTMGTFVNEVSRYRAKESVIVGEEHPHLKKEKNNIVASDVGWSSRKITKSFLPILTRLSKEFSEDEELLLLKTRAETLSKTANVDFYEAINLMESATRKIALLQNNRTQAESNYLLSFNQQLKQMHDVLTNTLKNNDLLENASEKDKSALMGLMDNFKSASEKENDPDKLKAMILSNVSSMKAGFSKIVDRQSLHMRKQNRALSHLESVVKQQDSQQKNLIKQHESMNDIIQSLEDMSLTDELTKTPNRRAYDKRVEQLDKAAKDESVGHNTMIVLDIDRFKRINDNYGHAFGDRVLAGVSSLIKKFIERKKLEGCDLYRYGGEEFVIICPNKKLGESAEIALMVKKYIAEIPFKTPKETLSVTVSIGVASYSKLDQTGLKVFEMADNCLYNAKKTGRNKVVLYHKGAHHEYLGKNKVTKSIATTALNNHS
jgi:diguanylate cyclase (GGDEF)-like protein